MEGLYPPRMNVESSLHTHQLSLSCHHYHINGRVLEMAQRVAMMVDLSSLTTKSFASVRCFEIPLSSNER